MLTQLRVQNFRNHNDTVCDFSSSTTIIIGKNGTGKTSLIEAIYIGYRGSSFKGSDKDIMRESADWYRIDIQEADTRVIRYTLDTSGHHKKSFELNGTTTSRLAQKYKLPIVLFNPDDLQLLSGSPARRRRYLDTLLTQLDPRYNATLRRYEQALMQRNKLLKTPHCTPDVVFPWNVILSEHGAYITEARTAIIETLQRQLTRKYTTIAATSDELEISYSHAHHTPQYLLAEYEASYQRDVLVGTTAHGPHRHDIILTMNTKPAHTLASRGENRTIILALKAIESAIVAETYQHAPLILLDDVYGELDDTRQQLVDSVFSGYQTIITSTHQLNHAKAQIITLEE